MEVLITPKRMWYVTYITLLLAALVLFLTFVFRSALPEVGVKEESYSAAGEVLMPESFRQKTPLQNALKSSFFSLAPVDRPVRLPDLRGFITFLGCNERPDLSLEKMRVQFTLRGGATLTASAGEKVYLRYEGRLNRWSVSEKPTCLSAVFKPRDSGVDVILEIENEAGTTVTTPSEYHQFFLNATASPSQGATSARKWDVGGLAAEPALLDKQGARWCGKDVMIEALGGEEFLYEAERERVQFGSEYDSYVLWVKEGDCFVFDDEEWKPAVLGEETKKKILLRAKKIDEKELLFDLWNPDGSLHAICSLKRRDAGRNSTMPEIKVIGARSQKHWIVEVDEKRIVLAPTDWIVFTEEGPVKIDTARLLDNYIEGSLSGALLAFFGIDKRNGEACLIGTFFDPTRSSKEEVSIPLYRSSVSTKDSLKRQDDDDDEDDPFLDDEDEEDDDDDES